MPKLRRSAVALLLWLAATAAQAAPAAPDPTYAALRAARPDGRRIQVHGLVLERDAFRFQFDSGAFYLLSPVAGRTFGAVFVGQGSYRLTPATRNERQHLALVSGGGVDFETLSDTFEDLVLLFADDTAAELQLHAPVETGPLDQQAGQVLGKWLDRQRKDFQTNFHLRILRDLVNSPNLTSGAFLALVHGKKYPPALAAVDPDGAEALGFGGRLGGEDTLLYVADENRGGFWYDCDRQGEVTRGKALPQKRLTDALDYRIETEIARDEDLKGTATVRFKVLVPGLRFVPVNLLPELRISEASYAVETAGTEPAWKPLPFIQEAEKEDADAAVVFPEPLAKEATVLLRLSYAGDKVLEDGGDKNYFVGARTSWYPNLGVFSDMADFDLEYRVPVGNEVISVGRKTGERTEGKQVITTWKTDTPAQVAGFNYGKFKKLEQVDATSGLTVQVFTNPGTPNFISGLRDSYSGGFDEDSGEVDEGFSGLGQINAGRLADSAMADGLNSARLFTTWFGPLPQKHVAITQQSQAFSGQSWPTLIFMPYISFLDGTQRQRLGLAQANEFIDSVGYHEFAHQWWGHLVGAATYRDQWLEEGFAEFSAALAVQHVKGWGAYDHFWSEARKRILDKYPGNDRPNWQAGPITLGYRLYTQRTPSAGAVVIYSKGAYVLHMLRLLMREPAAPDPDARFIALMRDYTATYAGKLATTADFQKIVERHMVPALNATGDGKVDWFFNQWVYGTEIPRYVSDLKVEKADGDQWRIFGQVKQQGVGKEFRAVVPLQVDFGKNETATIGLVPMIGETSVPVDVKIKLPKKPKKALVNAHGEVLARD
ncbi:MAG TPA: M1 family aminopeptidase [Thermoanaerobaculia bacterium]|nr:M1 family aminopeptidase [Thermoanaerobaculia bacterium]